MSVSTSRRAQARQTRERIRNAARELFLANGYAATTVTDIARTASVAPQTVYFTYGSKAAVLSTVIDAEIVGDLDPVPLIERTAAKRAIGASGAPERLRRIVMLLCEVTERVAPLYEIVRSGAADSDVRAILDRHEEQRRETHRVLLGFLAGDLRHDLDIDHASARSYALVSHEMYWLLVHRCGWTRQQWRRFAQQEIHRQLLPT